MPRPRRKPIEVETAAASVGVQDEHSTVEWARAVMDISQMLDKARMSERTAGGRLRHSLWQYGRENPKEFMKLVFKALDILDRNKNTSVTEYEEAENRSLAEMKSILMDAIAEAEGLTV